MRRGDAPGRGWVQVVRGDRTPPESSRSLEAASFISAEEAEGPWEEDRGKEEIEKIRRKASYVVVWCEGRLERGRE